MFQMAKAAAASHGVARIISLAPSQFEPNFISTAHSDTDIDETLAAAEAAPAVAWAW